MFFGMQLVIRVGMLMLRLMQQLFFNLCVMCCVICLWVSVIWGNFLLLQWLLLGVQCVFFDVFFEVILDDLVDVDVGGVDLCWVQFVGFDDFFYFDYCDVFGGGDQWVEVLCGVVIDDVVEMVGFLVFDDGEVVGDGWFEDVVVVIEFVCFFVFGDWGVVVGGGEEGWDVGVVGVDFFGQ